MDLEVFDMFMDKHLELHMDSEWKMSVKRFVQIIITTIRNRIYVINLPIDGGDRDVIRPSVHSPEAHFTK